VEGIPWIEQGIGHLRAIGAVLAFPGYLARKAEALYLADGISEAADAINKAIPISEKFEYGHRAELHRLRGVFLATLGADETQIEASFCKAVRIAPGAEFGFATETRGSNLRRISEAKSECVRRTWIPTNSLVIAHSALSLGLWEVQRYQTDA
jgi:hypothetical protein